MLFDYWNFRMRVLPAAANDSSRVISSDLDVCDIKLWRRNQNAGNRWEIILVRFFIRKLCESTKLNAINTRNNNLNALSWIHHSIARMFCDATTGRMQTYKQIATSRTNQRKIHFVYALNHHVAMVYPFKVAQHVAPRVWCPHNIKRTWTFHGTAPVTIRMLHKAQWNANRIDIVIYARKSFVAQLLMKRHTSMHSFGTLFFFLIYNGIGRTHVMAIWTYIKSKTHLYFDARKFRNILDFVHSI